MWKEIRQRDEYLETVAEVWRREQSLPKWFRAASSVWSRDMDEFLAFCDDCAEIWALMEGEKLTALVYVEKQSAPHVMNIHLSIIEKIEPAVFIEKAGELRNIFLRRGVRSIRGWILGKNFALARLLCGIGVCKYPVKLKHGESHGQILTWNMYELRRG